MHLIMFSVLGILFTGEVSMRASRTSMDFQLVIYYLHGLDPQSITHHEISSAMIDSDHTTDCSILQCVELFVLWMSNHKII